MRRVTACLVVVCALAAPGSGCGGDDDAADDDGLTSAGTDDPEPMNKPDASAAVDAGPMFDAGSDPERNEVEPGELCERLATIQCAGEAACCRDVSRDFDACLQAQMATCADLDPVAMDARTGFSADNTSAAFAQLEMRARSCDSTIAAWAASPDGLAGILTGTLAEGEDCEPESGPDTDDLGEIAVALASCTIGRNLACLPSDRGWTCENRDGTASPCATDLNCADGLYCEDPAGEGPGACAERKAAGEDCTGDTQCFSFMCRAGACAADDDVQAAYCLQ